MRNLWGQRSAVVLLLSMRLLIRQVSSLANPTKRIAIIGGGASGIFSAVSAVEHHANLNNKDASKLQVVVLEATSKTLSKVAISGGGRCNGEFEED